MKITKTETNDGITSHRLEGDTKCPYCSAKLDGTSIEDDKAPPKKGDLSVCIYCGGFLQFTGETE